MTFLRRDVIEKMSDKELNDYIRHLEYFYKDTMRSVHRYKKALKEARSLKTTREIEKHQLPKSGGFVFR